MIHILDRLPAWRVHTFTDSELVSAVEDWVRVNNVKHYRLRFIPSSNCFCFYWMDKKATWRDYK